MEHRQMATIERFSPRPAIIAWAALTIFAMPADGAAQTSVPRYEQGDCAFDRGPWADAVDLECGALLVREDPRRSDSRILRLPVAILHASEPESGPPLVMLHGGPGGSPVQLGLMTAGVAMAGVSRDRTVVLYDQRGAGQAQPILCTDFDVEDYEDDDPGARARFRAGAAACVESIRRDGGDPAMYSTAASVSDLIALRRALGYQRWHVWAESYGGPLAVHAMRADPDAIRSVALMYPVSHGLYRAERAKGWHDSLQRVFAACAMDPACAAASPTPEADLHALHERFRTAPLLIPSGEEVEIKRLDAGALVHAIVRLARSRSGIASIPFLLHELRHGDATRAGRELMTRTANVGAPQRPTFWLVECNDQYGPEFVALQDSIESSLPELYHVQRPLECDVWLEGRENAPHPNPGPSDIPTLIVTGHFDPAAPPYLGRRIAETLSNAYVYEIPIETHDPRDATPCTRSLLGQFGNDPATAPDASCIRTLPPIRFVTGWPERDRLLMAPTNSDDGRGTRSGDQLRVR
jgi:pimeloyl-ACP methyl ester carboxylesterase